MASSSSNRTRRIPMSVFRVEPRYSRISIPEATNEGSTPVAPVSPAFLLQTSCFGRPAKQMVCFAVPCLPCKHALF